jgi:hypothetical protein
MNRTFPSALGAFFVLASIAINCAPASAQSSFPTPGGSYVDGQALMCPNGSTDFQGRPVMVPCGGTSNPVQVNASVSASISGFTPTPSYATGTTSGSDQNVALPFSLVLFAFACVYLAAGPRPKVRLSWGAAPADPSWGSSLWDRAARQGNGLVAPEKPVSSVLPRRRSRRPVRQGADPWMQLTYRGSRRLPAR